MTVKYKTVFSPIKVGNIWLKNRIVCSPTGLLSDSRENHIPEEETLTFLVNHAKNGAAMVVMTGGNLFPVPPEDKSFIYDLYSEKGLNVLAHTAECFHMYGAKCSMELFHAAGGVDDYGVSDGVILPNGKIAREMPEAYMNRLADAYADAAENLMKAGFDGILLHFGHGWQVAQFLSPLTNHRTDAYGGSVENRARFPKMIIDRIRNRVGRKMLIDVRMSIDEFETGGLGISDAISIIEIFQDQIDMVNASCGLHNPKWFTTTHPCGFLPPMPNAYLAKCCKESGRIRIPVSAIGGIQDFEAAETLIAEGSADLIFIGRGFIADEEFAKKGFENRNEDIRPCIKCMRCHDSTVFGRKFRCSVNPVIGMEHVLEKLPEAAEKKKKVAVIGGGPAGMQAALTAANRGHCVTLFEKASELGGKLVFAKYVPFKYALDNYLKYQIRQVEKAAIEIKLNTEATPEMLEAQQFDVIIPALGAEAIVPPVPGIHLAQQAIDIYGKEEELPEQIVVVGGGQVGCETALHLAQRGRQVRLLEMRDTLAPDASPTHRNELMYQLCTTKDLVCEVGAKVTEIGKDYVVYEKQTGSWKIYNNLTALFGDLSGGAAGIEHLSVQNKEAAGGNTAEKAVLPTQAVILSAGFCPKEEDAWRFAGTAPQVIPVGDCSAPAATVEKATKEGYYAALQI